MVGSLEPQCGRTLENLVCPACHRLQFHLCPLAGVHTLTGTDMVVVTQRVFYDSDLLRDL